MVPGDDSDVPPAVSCARCRRRDCAGCAAEERREPCGPLAWETGDGTLHGRLWQTALATCEQPARVFGELPLGGVVPAFIFALLAELFAIGSLALGAALLLCAIMPDVAARILTSSSALAAAALLIAACSGVMVALHALWGVCLELGTGWSAARFRQGLRFGLYACGWDLLTSPAGVIQGLLTRGWRGAWRPITAATRVPRSALAAYLEQHRRLDDASRRRSVKLSVLVLSSALLAIAASTSVVALQLFF